jgi:hypothetical protein
MIELAADILVVIGPAAVVYYLVGDPWISVTWSIVGLTARWYQRRWQKPPYGGDDPLLTGGLRAPFGGERRTTPHWQSSRAGSHGGGVRGPRDS